MYLLIVPMAVVDVDESMGWFNSTLNSSLLKMVAGWLKGCQCQTETVTISGLDLKCDWN